ncbi:MAG: hypothetical protein ACQESX_06265 [Bacteroidota bacterium]
MKKPSTKKTVIKSILLIIAVFLLPDKSISQSETEKITLVYDQISVIDLLKEIEEQSTCTFFYSPDDFEDRKLKVEFYDRSIEYILNEIFQEEFLFERNEDEFVIFKNPDYSDKPRETTETVQGDTLETDRPEVRVRVDTVFQVRVDTITQTDTVYVRDTLIVRDTVFRQKVVKNAHKKETSFDNTLIREGETAKFYLSFFAGPVFSDLVYEGNSPLVETYSDAFSGGFSFAAGAEAGLSKGHFIAETGIALRRITENFEYTFEKPPETFYVTDTLDTYYTVENQDTTWYYVTDSSQQTVPGYEEKYNNLNEYLFVDIPVYLGYRFDIRNTMIELKAGVATSVLLRKTGNYIADEEDGPVKKLAELQSNMAYSGLFEAGGVYYFGKRLGMFGKINLRIPLKDAFHESYPLERKNNEVSVKAGVRISF